MKFEHLGTVKTLVIAAAMISPIILPLGAAWLGAHLDNRRKKKN